jgi:hypothetical protein
MIGCEQMMLGERKANVLPGHPTLTTVRVPFIRKVPTLISHLVNAIIFLCPISAFDQFLSEDRETNRLMDSFTMWTDLCRSPVLKKVPLVRSSFLVLNARSKSRF